MTDEELQTMFDGLQSWLDNPTTDRWEVWAGASIFYIYHPNKTRPASATPPAATEGRPEDMAVDIVIRNLRDDGSPRAADVVRRLLAWTKRCEEMSRLHASGPAWEALERRAEAAEKRAAELEDDAKSKAVWYDERKATYDLRLHELIAKDERIAELEAQLSASESGHKATAVIAEQLREDKESLGLLLAEKEEDLEQLRAQLAGERRTNIDCDGCDALVPGGHMFACPTRIRAMELRIAELTKAPAIIERRTLDTTDAKCRRCGDIGNVGAGGPYTKPCPDCSSANDTEIAADAKGAK